MCLSDFFFLRSLEAGSLLFLVVLFCYIFSTVFISPLDFDSVRGLEIDDTMRLLSTIVVGFAMVAAGDANLETVKGRATKASAKLQFLGINESGAEFGNTAIPGELGKDYTWPNK